MYPCGYLWSEVWKCYIIVLCTVWRLAYGIVEPLNLIFNKPLGTGLILSAWKYCIVSPVHKGGGKDDPDNFHLFSVIPVVGKILEKLIANLLNFYLEHYNFLHQHQEAYHHGGIIRVLCCWHNSSCFGLGSAWWCVLLSLIWGKLLTPWSCDFVRKVRGLWNWIKVVLDLSHWFPSMSKEWFC